ncbi:RING-H2 finger protein ATL52-like [Rutidosis leptorrhynchoides]|uniref:RING-H2 finger protein ATL52-like n=1 Tax=Rutidosis leptorrhynchoides TaxID=125765 RepID=UPI003A99BA2D
MGSLKDPKTWIPHINPKDCSQSVCNIYCTKWCKYVILSSPPPPPPLVKDDSGGATLSPVVITIISLIASFCLLIAYYFIISLCCLRNTASSVLLTREVANQETRDQEMDVEDHDQENDHLNYVPWLVLGKGLDEALIKSITLCKYKKGDGLVSCTDCLVCLVEFQEDESIRLLPKCSHAFHVHCIDTWLKTHSNCPLCRANVSCDVKSSQVTLPPPQPPPPALMSAMTSELRERGVSIYIVEEGERKIRRSKSMGYMSQTPVSRAQVLFFNEAEEIA